jgi:hypothetical protein
MSLCEQRKEECSNLIQEADAGHSLLDAFLELTVRGGKGDICRVGESASAAAAAAAGEQGHDAATPICDDRARVACGREGATTTCAVVGDDGDQKSIPM